MIMNNNKTTILLVLAAVLAFTSAQIIFSGGCPENVQTVESFDVEKYLGTWYEYAKYPVYFEANGKCVTAKYTLNEDGIVNVQNSLIGERNNTYEDIYGNATLVSPGKLLVKFPVSPTYTVSTNYWVLDTDYGNYTVVYSCTPMPEDQHATIVWILTREPLPQPIFIEKAVSVLENNNVSLLQLTITNQISCSRNSTQFLE